MASTSLLAKLLSSSVLEVVGEEETAKRPCLQLKEEHKECKQLVLKCKNENKACSMNTWVNHFENWRIARGFPLPLLKYTGNEATPGTPLVTNCWLTVPHTV